MLGVGKFYISRKHEGKCYTEVSFTCAKVENVEGLRIALRVHPGGSKVDGLPPGSKFSLSIKKNRDWDLN